MHMIRQRKTSIGIELGTSLKIQSVANEVIHLRIKQMRENWKRNNISSQRTPI
jgi:hypothetical protein